jgi:o-succinylbenzoate synthase
MKIQNTHTHLYQTSLINGQERSVIFIVLEDEKGNCKWGEIAPLPKWSKETLTECEKQLNEKKKAILKIDWTTETILKELAELKLFPSVLFGLESALLSFLSPLPEFSISATALFMGSFAEIVEQAQLRDKEGFTSAKLKISQLTFQEAAKLIDTLKSKFRLRIDVNRAWENRDSLQFFSQFPLDTFEYVEEPFQNPEELARFPHPLAIDESFPDTLSLKQLETFPTLKALIYKPTIQGGLLSCLPLYEWTKKRKIDLVLSSSFETPVGLAQLASIAHRLSITTPSGIGTFHYLKGFYAPCLYFSQGRAYIPVHSDGDNTYATRK